MTSDEAAEYLRERVRVQRDEKTSFNRLRWTRRDIAAVLALLPDDEEPQVTVTIREEEGEDGMPKYVIELAVIADAEDDEHAERIGATVAGVVQRAAERARIGRNGTLRDRHLSSVERVTVAHVDGDFLKETAAA